MPPKRDRPESFSPPPPAVYGLFDGVSGLQDRDTQSTSETLPDEPPVEENNVAATVGRKGDADVIVNARAGHYPPGDGIIYIDCSDEEEGVVHRNSAEASAGTASGKPLLGLHPGLMAQSATIMGLLTARVDERFVKLTEIAEHSSWNNEDHLSDKEGRALVIVAFGSLHFVNIMFGRSMVPSFSVTIELLREEDGLALQQLLDWAGSDEQDPMGMLRAFRAGHDEHARFLNVYSCMRGTSPDDDVTPCGINEFAAGDVVRLVMRCIKVVDAYNGRVSVDFKLRRVDLVVPIPRRNDIRN